MIMNKFQKKISKLCKNSLNVVVVGQGFGQLNDIVEIFNTVFVLGGARPETKSRNLVYRENLEYISDIEDVGLIFVDRNQIEQLKSILPLWNKTKAIVAIEGHDPIEREFSKSLYDSNYNCTELYKTFHTWELKK